MKVKTSWPPGRGNWTETMHSLLTIVRLGTLVLSVVATSQLCWPISVQAAGDDANANAIKPYAKNPFYSTVLIQWRIAGRGESRSKAARTKLA